MEDYAYIQRNLAAVQADMARVASDTGHAVPTLVAVTKSASDEEVLALCACGITDMAENRVPLFRARADLLAAHGFSPRLHLIGSLQTNKVKYIAAGAALIQSLDSPHLAAEIERQGARIGRRIPVLCEINSGREAAKGGILPEDCAAFLSSLSAFPHIALMGLMTMGPACETEEEMRPYFRLTRLLCEEGARAGRFAVPSPILSMGMSHSYRAATAEGATMVRVGRRLFEK